MVVVGEEECMTVRRGMCVAAREGAANALFPCIARGAAPLYPVFPRTRGRRLQHRSVFPFQEGLLPHADREFNCAGGFSADRHAQPPLLVPRSDPSIFGMIG